MNQKKLQKIISETDFLVMAKGNGWKGFNIFARHRLWSKFSCDAIVDIEPELTDELREKIVLLAIETNRVEKNNHPLYFEREKHDNEWRDCADDISRLLWDDEARKQIIDLLEKECEWPHINHIFQRIKDMDCAKQCIREIESRKLPCPSRIVVGSKEG